MNTNHTLGHVKSVFRTDKVVETATSFVLIEHGKYKPNISFVIRKDYGVNPLEYRKDAAAREMIAGLGLGFGTAESGVSVLFGDFWLSKAGKPHFRPKPVQEATHVIVRANWGGFNHPRTRGQWGAPEGVTYFRRASSNGGGTGYDYYVVPVGFYLVVRDEEIDGDTVVAPDFAARAKEVRAAFAQFDAAEVEKAVADAEAKAEAETSSRAAKPDLLPRLEAAQIRLEALMSSNSSTSYSKLELGESYFVFGRSEKLYIEANVVEVDKGVAYWEEQSAERKQREAEAPRLEALELLRKEELATEQARVEAEAQAKAELEAAAKSAGLPSDVWIWKRSGATNAGNGWVISPKGVDREADALEGDPRRVARYNEGNLIWRQIMPGELVICWGKAFTAAPHEFQVLFQPETITEAQLERVAEIQQELEDTWAGRRGLASGNPSPAVGRGWGLGNFETPHKETEVVYSTIADEAVLAKPLDMQAALRSLQEKFGK